MGLVEFWIADIGRYRGDEKPVADLRGMLVLLGDVRQASRGREDCLLIEEPRIAELRFCRSMLKRWRAAGAAA